MRKYLIPLAAAAATLGAASPAAAQFHVSIGTGPSYAAPGYGTPYGYGYGHRMGAGQWMQQLQQIRYQTRMLANQGRLTRSEMRDMTRDIRSAQRAVRLSARRGVNQREAYMMDRRIARLQYQLQRYSDWDRRRYDRRYDRRYSYGYGW